MRSANPTKASVVIVDDEAPVRQFVRRVLDEAGYVTTVVGSAAAALELIADAGAPDLLLTDLRMPEMDGDVLATRLRAMNPDLKVLYLTGFADDLFTQRGHLWEGEAFLEKPCSVKGLREAVAMILFGHTVPDFNDASTSPGTFRS